ncbi:hypothetical protein IAD21_06043 [Abditibacteriota bacterium]|nr:hypothetical protein IAD21_06043 [Abditibacteriota bacterium]
MVRANASCCGFKVVLSDVLDALIQIFSPLLHDNRFLLETLLRKYRAYGESKELLLAVVSRWHKHMGLVY